MMESLLLPPELMDSIFENMVRNDVKTVIKYRSISKYYKNIIDGNKYICDVLAIAEETNLTLIENIFMWACARGKLEIAARIFNKAELLSSENILEYNITDAFICNCEWEDNDREKPINKLKTLKWLTDTFGLFKGETMKHNRVFYIFGFIYACRTGNLKVADWLFDELKMAKEEYITRKFHFEFKDLYDTGFKLDQPEVMDWVTKKTGLIF